MSRRAPPLVPPPAWWWRIGGAVACGAIGWGGGLAWHADVAPVEMPNLTLRLAFALGLPWPLLLLGQMSRPALRPVRSMLGQTAAAQVADELRRTGGWLLIALSVPAGMFAAGPPALPALLGCGMAGAGLLAVAMLAAALAAMGRGTAPGWARVAGGGAFGPAEAAPLLYAPAVALVAAQAPVGFLAALWQAWPDLVPQRTLAALALGVTLLEGGVAWWAWRRARPWLHAGLVAVDEAHAVRFLAHEDRTPAPAWLVPRDASAAWRWFATALHRSGPDVGFVTLAAAGTAALVLGSHAHVGATAAVAAVIAAHASGRAVRVLAAWPAARWLGLAPPAARAAVAGLALRLLVPAAGLVGVAATSGHWLGVALGATGGGAVGLWFMRTTIDRALGPTSAAAERG